MPKKVSNHSKETMAEGKFMRLTRVGHWEFAERNNASGAVLIVAITPKGKLILTEQFRVPFQASVLELPAGLVGDIPGEEDEEWIVAARRELLEETGYHAKKIKHVASGPVSPGFGTETVSIFLAQQLEKIAQGGGVDGEDIVVHEIAVKSVPGWLRKKQKDGLLVDPKIYAGLYFAEKAMS